MRHGRDPGSEPGKDHGRARAPRRRSLAAACPALPEEERGPFAGALPGTLLAAGYGLGIALLPLLAGPGKYFTDDMGSQFVPALYAIGATLRAEGAVPLFTAQTWFGGSLAAEFQYGLFNPVLLLAYALLPGFATLTGAAAFLGAVFTALLGAGGFVATGAGVYLTVTAGWPQTVLVLGLFVACHCAALALTGRWRDAAWPALAAALGVGAAAVALLPLFGMAEVAQRLSGVVAGGAMVPDLGDALAVSQPFHFGYLMHVDGYSALPAPMFQAAWFVLPVACLLAWGRVPWRDPTLRTLLALTALTLLATQGRSQFGPLRWPVRYLPYFQVGLVLLTLLMVARAGFAPLDAVRRRLLAGAVLVSTLLAWQSVPSPFFVALLSGLLLGLATAALLAVGLRDLAALGCVLAAWLRVNTHGTTCETAAARLLAADLPLGARGTLVLEFRPPGFATCLAVSAGSASLLLLLGLAQALLAARRRRGGAPIGPVPGP